VRRVQILIAVAAGLLWAAPAAVRAEDNGVIKGKVLFKGDKDKYKRIPLDTTKDPNCAKTPGKEKIGSYNVILNTKTEPITVRNVLVHVKDGLGDRKFTAPKEPAIMDQKGCEYTPHVLAVMEGQEVIIRNSDDTNHNIHFLPKVNEEFNKTQPKKDMEDKVALKAEEPFHIKCDVHPWMGAWCGVFKHPFFAVTGEDGSFELKGLPAGKYKVVAWHETFGTLSMDVDVASGASVQKDFTYEPK